MSSSAANQRSRAPGADAQTTPRRARPFVVAGLAGVALYFLLCFILAVASFGKVSTPALLHALEPVLWPGRWRMFTDLRTTHIDLDAEIAGLAGVGGWQPLSLADLYPARWDEGPGYTRDAFLGDANRVDALALDVCARTGAERVRLTRVVFAKTPGSVEQPRVDAVSTVLSERACAR